MKKKLGVTLFLLLTLFSCYTIERLATKYGMSQLTYGTSTQKKQTAQQSTENSVEVLSKITTENEKSKLKEEQPIRKVVYLTFDDGPSDNTIKVLETLKKHNIKATFFMIAKEITPERESLVKQMIADGHQVGVHTYCHKKNEIYCSKEACLNDFKAAYNKLVEVTGVSPTVFRFPYGSANSYICSYCNDIIREMDSMGLTYIDWNVSAEDAVGKPTSYSILKNVKKFEKYNEPVVLMHDGSSNTLTAKLLPQIIDKMIAAGYEFDTIDHRSKPYQWSHDWMK